MLITTSRTVSVAMKYFFDMWNGWHCELVRSKSEMTARLLFRPQAGLRCINNGRFGRRQIESIAFLGVTR